MMKRWITLLLLAVVTIGLAACGNGDETAEEIYTNALEAAEDMESAEVEIEMKQEMTIPGESAPIIMDSDMTGSMILEPIAMHQKGIMSMSMDGESMDMDQELYLVDNEIYSYDSMTSQWMKMDESLMEQIANTSQMDMKEQLDMLKDYVDDLEIEESDGTYILTFSPDSEDVKGLAEELLQEALPAEITGQMGEEVTEVLNNTEIQQLFVEMTINNDTYQIEAYDMDMEMTMHLEGQEMNMKQNVMTKYNNINSVESIEIPQEVKDSAVELPGF